MAPQKKMTKSLSIPSRRQGGQAVALGRRIQHRMLDESLVWGRKIRNESSDAGGGGNIKFYITLVSWHSRRDVLRAGFCGRFYELEQVHGIGGAMGRVFRTGAADKNKRDESTDGKKGCQLLSIEGGRRY